MTITNIQNPYGMAALLLRSGLGLVFIIGGLSKLSLLFSHAKHDAMVANYMGTSGYINELFQQYLFSGALSGIITPSLFLTSLSTFELFSGIALVAGFMVRPLALIYGFLLWSFVVSLPVMTVPGVEIGVKTYTSPAIFVQIRDIALSGMMFVLFNLGAGLKSIDAKFITPPSVINWDAPGLVLRLSLGLMFIVCGFFGNFANIPTFATWQPLLALLGLLFIFGNEKAVRAAGAVAAGVMLWYMFQKLSMDKDIIANLNGFKREFALGSAAAVLTLLGGGSLFTLKDLLKRSASSMQSYIGRGSAV